MTDEMLDQLAGRAGCQALNASGALCNAPARLVEGGYCHAHRPGGMEAMRERAVLGGRATAAKLAGQGFVPDDLPPILTLDDAKRALDAIRVAVLTRRISHAEGNAAAKAVDSWLKAEGQAVTARLVGDLKAELDAKDRELALLRKQLSGAAKAPRVVA